VARRVARVAATRRCAPPAAAVEARPRDSTAEDPLMLAGVTLHNFLVGGAMAVLFIIAFKKLADMSNVGGLKSIAAAI
jgi:hypothetical protein